MFIAIMSVIVAALVGVPVVTKLLDPKEPKEPEPSAEPSLGPQRGSEGSAPAELNSSGPESALSAAPIKVNPDALGPEQDPFSDLDLQEIAALTNSPALLEMMGLGELQPAPQPSPQGDEAAQERAEAPAPQSSRTNSKTSSKANSSVPKKSANAKSPKPKKSLVSVNWEGDWSDPPPEVPPPADDVEKARGTPSADALFDADIPVISKAPANHRRRSQRPSKPREPAREPGATKKTDKPQKLREVGAPAGAVSARPARPPLKLFVDEAPEPLSAQSPYEVLKPSEPSPQERRRSSVFERASDSVGSARETLLDFQPFFALDALRVINEAGSWSRDQQRDGRSKLVGANGEELDIAINEELPEWSLLLAHVNGFLFDLAQDQLRRQSEEIDFAYEGSLDLSRGGGSGVAFRQSQWANVATEEFIAKGGKPQLRGSKPRSPKRFMREG